MLCLAYGFGFVTVTEKNQALQGLFRYIDGSHIYTTKQWVQVR